MLRRVTEKLIHGAAAAVDRAATLAVEKRARSTQRVRPPIAHETRVLLLERLRSEYPQEASLEFFGAAPRIAPTLRHVRSERGRQVLDVTWPSPYTAHVSTFAERYGAVAENQFGIARLFVREAPRPIAVVIHGYLTGHFGLEERLWPLDELDARGFDVALFVLPFHGLRGRFSARRVPEFPGTDPRMTNEGFRHAMRDLRGLIRWLRERGHPRLGLLGMSLGGYTAALAATIETDLDFLVPIVPLSCLADFAREQAWLSEDAERRAIEHALLERVYRVVSPVSLAPQLDSSRVLVVAARADQVTPIAHARRLANHFGAPLVAWPGGHLLQLGRKETFERVYSLLERVAR